jgi:hypothetical protein
VWESELKSPDTLKVKITNFMNSEEK